LYPEPHTISTSYAGRKGYLPKRSLGKCSPSGAREEIFVVLN